MNARAVVRLPKSHQGRFAAMLQALGEDASPATLIAMLVDYADSPEGGRWLLENYRPAPKGEEVVPEPISWFNSEPIPAHK